MKKELCIIIGSGGLAKEVYSLISNIKRYKVLGFISREKKNKLIIDNIRVLGDEKFLIKNFKNLNLIIAIGDKKKKKTNLQKTFK